MLSHPDEVTVQAIRHIDTGRADGACLARSAAVALTSPRAPLSWLAVIAGLRYSHGR